LQLGPRAAGGKPLDIKELKCLNSTECDAIFCPSGQTSADETASAMFRRVATAEAPGIIARRLAPSESTMNPAVALLVILDTLFFAVAWNGSREALF
jgi:hypothetical protein